MKKEMGRFRRWAGCRPGWRRPDGKEDAGRRGGGEGLLKSQSYFLEFTKQEGSREKVRLEMV